MEKEFEALDRLKTAPSFMGGTDKYRLSTNSASALLEDYELVKQALTTKSKMEQAFEIIIEKDVDVSYLKYDCHFALCLYNKYMIDDKQLTPEEYDLLREVLE